MRKKANKIKKEIKEIKQKKDKELKKEADLKILEAKKWENNKTEFTSPREFAFGNTSVNKSLDKSKSK